MEAGKGSLLFKIQSRQQEGWKINGRIDERDEFLTLSSDALSARLLSLTCNFFLWWHLFSLCLLSFESLSLQPVNVVFVLPRQASLPLCQSCGGAGCVPLCASPLMHAFGQLLNLCSSYSDRTIHSPWTFSMTNINFNSFLWDFMWQVSIKWCDVAKKRED